MPSPFNQPRDNMRITDPDGKKSITSPTCQNSVQRSVGILIIFLVTKKQKV